MSIWTIIHIANLLLWTIMAANVLYVAFFTLTAHLPARKQVKAAVSPTPTFLVLFPAYHEDAVIVRSVKTFLKQDYPRDHYHVVVISDHMADDTNRQLSALPVTLLQPTFQKSSKAKALQYAIDNYQLRITNYEFDYVLILDADNIVAPDFLSRLSRIVNPHQAIQCHRTAKNADNHIAALDGISEEINNSLFRRGHNRIGLSSALIGSGMCFNYQWFKAHVHSLDSAVEDRELEALLMRQRIHIHYAEDLLVMDEKVSSSDNFQRQRLRWMTGQAQALLRMLPHLPQALITGNVNYIDKTLQQALIPRSILLLLLPLLLLLSFLLFRLTLPTLLWLVLTLLLFVAILMAIPPRLRTAALARKALALPSLACRMAANLLHIHIGNKDFSHTTHSK